MDSCEQGGKKIIRLEISSFGRCNIKTLTEYLSLHERNCFKYLCVCAAIVIVL